MGWWKELPFRGDGKSRDIKPRRRFINIKKNRREIIVSILIIIFILIVPFGCLITFGESPNGDNTTEVASAIIGVMFVLALVIGVVSISKFRKGYDIEVPDEPEDQKDKSSKAYMNTID